jgi:predicted DNA binding CopG/RHH family protein
MSDKEPKKLKQFPRFKTDEEAEHFVETADLTEYDFSQFKPARFEFEPKNAQLNMRLPQDLLDALRARAKERGIPYTRFIREIIEREVSRSDR